MRPRPRGPAPRERQARDDLAVLLLAVAAALLAAVGLVVLVVALAR